jgi:hypothetical protein
MKDLNNDPRIFIFFMGKYGVHYNNCGEGHN